LTVATRRRSNPSWKPANAPGWRTPGFWKRALPHLYALRNVVRADPEGDQELEEEIPAEVLARHRALLLEQAREDEARANLTQGEPAA